MRIPLFLLLPSLLSSAAQAADPPTFTILSFGAREYKDDDKFKSTKAINKAIEEASLAKDADKTGVIVKIPKGKWMTGPILLRDNVTLYLEKDANLVFSDHDEDDPPKTLTRWEGIECVNYAGFIRARGAKNIAITGKGSIDANGKWWWRMYRTQEEARRRLREATNSIDDPSQRTFGTISDGLRPSFIQLIDCQNVRFEGFTLRNPPMWAIHPIYCKDVVCKDLHVIALGPDGDGVVPDSSKNVTIENCTFDCYEDCVAIKSGRDRDGRDRKAPSEDITVKGCTFIRGNSAVAIGSEMSGSVRRVNITQCLMKGVKRGLRIKTMRGRGGEIDGVKFTHCKIIETGETAVHIDMQFNPTPSAQFDKETTPVVQNILIWAIESEGGWRPWFIQGLPESRIKGLKIAQSKLRADRGIEVRHVNIAEILQNEVHAKEGWSLYATDVQDWVIGWFKPLKAPGTGPVIALRNADSVSLKQIRAPEETDVFLRIAGKDSKDITLTKCITTEARHRLKFEDGAVPDAVKDTQTIDN